MRTLDERIETARTRAERFTRWAQEASDEAKGAEACGLLERAEKCRRVAKSWIEDADVFAASAGKLTTERRQDRGGDWGTCANCGERHIVDPQRACCLVCNREGYRPNE
jgi:hypothetical protein